MKDELLEDIEAAIRELQFVVDEIDDGDPDLVDIWRSLGKAELAIKRVKHKIAQRAEEVGRVA